MLFDRQKRLLALVDSLGGAVGSLDFQKLLLLYCREVEETPTFEFIPYKFGGFSFTSYADKRRLIQEGLLADEERAWKLTPAGQKTTTVAPPVRMRMDKFAKAHTKLRGDALITSTFPRSTDDWRLPNDRPPPLGLPVMPDVWPNDFSAGNPFDDPASPRGIGHGVAGGNPRVLDVVRGEHDLSRKVK